MTVAIFFVRICLHLAFAQQCAVLLISLELFQHKQYNRIYKIHTSFFRDSRSKFFSSFRLLLIRSRLRFSIIGFEDYKKKLF